MAKHSGINPNLPGILSVLIWGSSIAIAKMFIAKIGLFAYVGGLLAFCGLLGLIKQTCITKTKIDKKIFKNPYLYGRWASFVIHLTLFFTACSIVNKDNIALVILLNYLWPTAIILFSVMFAGVHVTRGIPFTIGLTLVLVSLSVELLGPEKISSHLFDNQIDVLAYILAFIGAICWGLYSMLSRKAGDSTGGGAVVPFFQLTLGLALPISFLPGMATWQNLDLWNGILLLGYGLCQFVAYLCWDYGMRKGNIVFLSLCADFLPWISLAASCLILNVSINLKTVLAGVLLVIGAIITRYGTLAKKKKTVTPYTQGEAI